MRPHEASIFVFVACIIIGILISLNISFGKNTSRIFLNSMQYQEAYNNKMKLQKDINNLTQQYNEYYQKIRKYEQKGSNNSEIVNDMQKEADNNKMLLSETAVKGEGIKVTLRDGKTDEASFTKYNLVHDSDVINVINDLRNAGAEAIAVNGHRITETSSIVCGNAFIMINGIKEPVPFVIEAIGKKEALMSYIKKPENYIKYLTGPLRGLNVEIQENDEIDMPPVDIKTKNKYISEIK